MVFGQKHIWCRAGHFEYSQIQKCFSVIPFVKREDMHAVKSSCSVILSMLIICLFQSFSKNIFQLQSATSIYTNLLKNMYWLKLFCEGIKISNTTLGKIGKPQSTAIDIPPILIWCFIAPIQSNTGLNTCICQSNIEVLSLVLNK